MLHSRTLAWVACTLMLLTGPQSVFAQDVDEDTTIVAEELAIEDALEGELLVEELEEALPLDDMDEDLDLFGDVPMIEDVPLEDTIAEDISAEDDLLEEIVEEDDGLDALEVVEDIPEIADAPVEEVLDLDDGLGGLDEIEEVVEEALPMDDLELEEVAEVAEDVEDVLDVLEEDDVLGGLDLVEADPIDAAVEDVPALEDDLLEGLLVEEDVAPEPVDGREEVVGVEEGLLEKGVPGDLLTEEVSIDDALEDFDAPDVAGIEDPMDEVPADPPVAAVNEDIFSEDIFAAPGEAVAETVEATVPAAVPEFSAPDQGLPDAAPGAGDIFGNAVDALDQPGTAMPGEVVSMPAVEQPVVELSNAQQSRVELMREAEELRRKAFLLHAQDRLAAAERMFQEEEYIRAIEIFEEARRALSTLGYLEEVQDDLFAIRGRITECKYQHASVLTKYNVYEDALKFAREASLEAHPKAPRLVEILQKRLEGKTEVVKTPTRRWREESYRKKVANIKERLGKGRDHFVAQEYEEALEEFEGVLRVSPQNTEAIRWREKVSQTINDRSRLELASTRDDMMRQVSDAWNPRDYGAKELSLYETVGPTDDTKKQGNDERRKILDKMRKIKIPEVDFRQAIIHDVMGFLQEQSIEHDDPNLPPEERGVNIILNISSLEGAGAAGAAPADDFGFDFGAPAEGAGGGAGAVPRITFRARNISMLEAMDLVTEIARLKYRVQGSVVLVIPLDDPGGEIIHKTYSVQPTISTTITELSADLSGPQAVGGGGGFFPIEGGDIGGADTTDWKGFFATLGVAWPRGSSIRYIPSIGKLLVANTVENLAIFEEKLSDLDVVPRQIEIEARFVEIAQSDLNSFGLEYNLTDDWEVAQKKGANGAVGTSEQIVLRETGFTKGNRFLTEISNTEFEFARPDDLLRFASVLTNPELEVVLHAIQAKGNSDLLSAPKVTTQNGLEATIKVVTEYIYPSDYTIEPGTPSTLNSDGSVQSAGQPPVVTPAAFETREVGVILAVLPEVSPEGQMINLTLTPEVVTEPDWRDYGQEYTDANGQVLRIPIEQPFFHTRSISTSIMIYNGATVVMGGMISEVRNEVDDRVPFLGDIPVLGRLFRSTYENSEKRNLLIFVTARLVDPRGRPVGNQDTMSNLFTANAADEAEAGASAAP